MYVEYQSFFSSNVHTSCMAMAGVGSVVFLHLAHTHEGAPLHAVKPVKYKRY